ncbi:MAG: MFS transporter [Haloferacaceae archaeon]
MTEETNESLVGGYAGRLLGIVSVGWLTFQGGRLLLPPLLPQIIETLEVTPFAAGVGISTLWGCYALLQYPSGRLSDRLSRKTLLVAGLGFGAAGFALLSTAVVYPVFLFAAAVVGVGSGLYPTAARALISDHFEEKRAAAFGLHIASGDLGGGVAAGAAVVVLAVATWQSAFLPVAALLGAVALAVHLHAREPYEVRSVDLDVRGATRRVAAQRRLRWLILAYMGFAFSWQATAGFLPTFLQVSKGLSPALASTGFASLFVVGAAVKPVAGRVGDGRRKPLVAAGVLGFGALGLLALLLVEGTVPVLAATVAYAVGLMGYPPVMQSYLMDVFPESSRGADLGYVRTLYIGVGAVGPAYVGFVAGRASYVAAFASIVCLIAVSASIIAWRSLAGD